MSVSSVEDIDMKRGTRDAVDIIREPCSLRRSLWKRYRQWRFARLILKLCKYFPPGDHIRIAVDPKTDSVVGIKLGLVPEIPEIPMNAYHDLSELVEHPDEMDE